VGGRIGLDPRLYGGHSLRAGLVTQAYVNGASFHSIMQQTGHRSIVTVRKYIRDATLFRDNSAAKLGL
jgi:integrase